MCVNISGSHHCNCDNGCAAINNSVTKFKFLKF